MINTKLMSAIVSIISMVGLSPMPASAQDFNPPAELVAAAQKEGKIVYYSAFEVPALREVIAKFNKRYPQIEVVHFRAQPSPAVQHIIAGQRAGKIEVDVLDSPISFVQPLIDRDLLKPYDWSKSFGTGKDYQFYDGRLVNILHLDMPVAYNTNLVKAGEIKTWDDILAPKWRGKIVMEARGMPFAVLATSWGQEKTEEFLKKLMANRPQIILGGTPVLEALAGGQASIAIGSYGGKVELYKERSKAPLEWVRDTVPATTYALGVMEGAPHQNAARLWTAWLASREGQDALDKEFWYASLKGDHVSRIGKELRAKNIPVVIEPLDIAQGQKLLDVMSRIIGSTK